MLENYTRQAHLRLFADIAYYQLKQQLWHLRAALERLDKNGYHPNQPRVPAGHPDGGQWTSIGGGEDAASIARQHEWARPGTLKDHLDNHGKDFSAKSMQEYAKSAQEFRVRAQTEGLPTVVDKDGVVRSYDPKTNTFGAYNKNGTTRTFYKPKTGVSYYNKQVIKEVGRGGRVVYPLENTAGPESPGYRGVRVDAPPYGGAVGGGGGGAPKKPGRGPLQE